MTDNLECYYLAVVDDAGVLHHIAISKGDGSGKRLTHLESSLYEAGLKFIRYIPSPRYSSQAKDDHAREGKERDAYFTQYAKDLEQEEARNEKSGAP